MSDRFAATNEIRLHYLDHGGDGPVLVLAPGLTANAHSFDGLMRAGLGRAARVHPGLGAAFSGWSGGGCAGTGTCTVSMSADRSVTAQFAFFTSVPPTTTITRDPASPNGPGGSYVPSVHLTVTAQDDSGIVAETRCELDPATAPASFGDLPPGCDYLGSGADVSSVGTHRLYAASVDGQGNEEIPVHDDFEVVHTPDAPEAVTAVGKSHKAIVSWEAPSSDGGRSISGYTVTASPGGATQTVAPSTTTATFTGLANCQPYSFSVTAANAAGTGADGDATTTPASLFVTDAGYSRKLVTIPQGRSVAWCFDPANSSSHSVTSDTGLFDSGAKAAGDGYSKAFLAAGRYPYHSASPDSMKGTVSIKLILVQNGTSSLITWASAAPPPGSSSDVQVKQPGSTKWLDWRPSTTAVSGTFGPSDPLFTGQGVYSFRARLRSMAGLSSWSSPSTTDIG